ncbi:uncharacterized protein [Dermacentor albipictus]|uniref:uncharacterized protein isoform X6 n=1 Tax=Dermacentor albipictus TaxID=60249 RepID=UPI0038FC018A
MEKESELAAQRRRRAEKLNSSDPEVVAWQLAVERRKNEQKKAKRTAETPEQREERLAKRRRQEAQRRARPSQQQQQQDAIDDVKARRVCAGSTAGDSIGLKREVADTPPDTGGDSLDLLIPLSPLVHGQRGKNRSCAPDAALNGCSRSAAEELSLWTSGQHGCGKPGSRLESAQGGVHPVRLTMDAPSTPCNGNLSISDSW